MDRIDFKQANASELTLIATGSGQQLQTTVVNKEGTLVVRQIKIDAFLAATSGSHVAGTPIPATAASTANNTFQFAAGTIGAQLTIGSQRVHNGYTPLLVWRGFRQNDGILTDPWYIPMNENVILDVSNTSGLNVSIALNLIGYRVRGQ